MRARKFVSGAVSSILFSALLPGSAARLDAAIQQDSAIVELRSRRVALSRQTTDSFFGALRATPGPALHGLALLQRAPTADDRSLLARHGLTVLTPVGHLMYLARVAKTLEPGQGIVREFLNSLALLEPADKVRPDVWRGEYERFAVMRRGRPTNYVLNPDSTLTLLVSFYATAPPREIAAVLHERVRSAEKLGDRDWLVVVSRLDLAVLAGLDIVYSIDPSPAPFTPDNDKTRAAINADAVQQWDPSAGHAAGLGGAGVQVGVFDQGIDEDHPDFHAIVGGALGTGRVLLSNPAARQWHGTIVAGVIAGNGWQSNKKDSWGADNGGTAYQWRGMAPESQLIEAVAVKADGITLDFQTAALQGYIQNQGMDLSNHSYRLVDNYGEYGDLSALHDRLIRGDEFVGGVRVPRRLEVFSAGNAQKDGYFSLTNEVKNGLIVGNWNVAANRINGNSSLGPTFDGRIKPDVVAPGTFIHAPGFRDPAAGDPPYSPCDTALPAPSGSGPRRNFYAVDCGTSLAAPAVTGLLALVLQQYAATYNLNLDHRPPLPSTLRGLVIHSAHDLASPGPWFTDPDPKIQALPGPDFVTGFGLVDVDGAVDLVKRRLIIEDQIDAPCQTKTYNLMVTPALWTPWPYTLKMTLPVKVTLAWDDVASTQVVDRTAPRLINDLDLELIDPTGGRHYPWLLDQEVVDRNKVPVPSDQQACGTELIVNRKMSPFDAKVPAEAVIPASTGRDHRNNVEQVLAEGPPGRWKVKVSGFNLGLGPQRFSLVGVSPPRIWVSIVDVKALCNRLRAACQPLLPNPCEQYPPLCERIQYIPIHPRGLTPTFQAREDRVIVPLVDLCMHLGGEDGCNRPGATYEVALGPAGSPLRAELYSTAGRRVAGDTTARRVQRLTFTPQDGERYFILLSPSRATPIGRALELPATVRSR